MSAPFSIYLLAVATALCLTPVVVALCRRLGLVDEPGVRKVHAAATPSLGGIAVVGTVLIVIAVALLSNAQLRLGLSLDAPIVAALTAALLVFALGIYDDVIGLGARYKLFAQLLIASILCLPGIRIDAIQLADGWTLELGWLAAPLTVLWLVAMTNAVNLIDGMDGLASGICALAAGVVALLAWQSGQVLLTFALLGVSGALVGFLFFNFHPAKIFLGDSGSLFLGFFIAASALLVGGGTPTFDVLAISFVALSVPVLDTSFAMVRRFLQRRSIFSPDRNHLHHRLLHKGVPQRRAALLLYVYAAVPMGMTLFLLGTSLPIDLLLVSIALLLQVAVFRFWGAVRLKESWRALRRKREIMRAQGAERRRFEAIDLRFREAEAFASWWEVVIDAAKQLGFTRLDLVMTAADEDRRQLSWETDNAVDRETPAVRMTLPVPQHATGEPAEITVTAPIGTDSLEAIARRLTWLGRLLDEHSIARLDARPAVTAEPRLKHAN